MVQAKVEPAGDDVNAIAVASPEQMVEVAAVVTVGFGLTVTVMVSAVPGQPVNVGVTIYCTVPAVVPGLVRFCAIVEPLPFA